MPISIVEVIRRAAQGRTAPYICRGDDGAVYFVKNRALPRRELVSEWLAAQLAEQLNIPIAPHCIVDVPSELVDPAMGAWLSELGGGPAFASRLVEASELSWQQVADLPKADKAIVGAFDLWIHNMDRTLSRLGGNPNILWRRDVPEGGLVVIDHNLAFDATFNANTFLETHVFADDVRKLVGDFFERESIRQQFVTALPRCVEACGSIPDEWRYVDPELTIEASWTEQDFLVTLERCQDQEHFWDLPA